MSFVFRKGDSSSCDSQLTTTHPERSNGVTRLVFIPSWKKDRLISLFLLFLF